MAASGSCPSSELPPQRRWLQGEPCLGPGEWFPSPNEKMSQDLRLTDYWVRIQEVRVTQDGYLSTNSSRPLAFTSLKSSEFFRELILVWCHPFALHLACKVHGSIPRVREVNFATGPCWFARWFTLFAFNLFLANECTISTLILKVLVGTGNSANQETNAALLSWGELANII